MTSIGAIFGIIIAGAVAVGAYALYKARSDIGASIESRVYDPVGQFFRNLAGVQETAGGAVPAGTGIAGNPNEPAFGFIPPAQAPTPAQALAETNVPPSYYQQLETKYGPKAQAGAISALGFVQTADQPRLITMATEIAKKSPTPITTQAQVITDYIRTSVGGKEPLTNKFYRLLTLSRQPAKGFYDPLPLSREAVQFYATKGLIAHEVYL